MNQTLKVVKIGGQIIEDAAALKAFLQDFQSLSGPKILVHGGGKTATEMSAALGISSQMHQGRRITTSEDLKVVTMVYAGLVNKQIVAELQSLGCYAIGLSGTDGDSIRARRRPAGEVDWGWVGDVTDVNGDLLQGLLQLQLTPVFCALSHDGKGQLLNTNADTIAAEMAIALSAYYPTELCYCFEKQGVLSNPEDETSVIPLLDSASYVELKKQGAIHSGMIPKLTNCFYALQNGVQKVTIGKAADLGAIDDCGTELILNKQSA